MRFAYIDSNGNEVPIPSVDALALRIELGAIHASTELYDAQADQWGPAHEHEIFHALARAAEDEHRGFAAPLPPFPLTRAASEAATGVVAEAATGVVAEATAIETLPEPEVDPVADDDLTRVHGIGPKLEEVLKELGITSYRQIANFQPEDVEIVGAALGGFRGRIERDDWISSAAEQHLEKYGEPA